MGIDKTYKFFGVLAIAAGVISLTVGKWILAFVAMTIGFAVFFTSKKGSYNETNLYDKKVAKGDKTLSDLFEHLKDVETPLGACWMGKFKGQEAIVYGPSAFKDIVVIIDNGKEFNIKNSNVVAHIEASEEEQWRLEKVIDTTDLAVTPKRFSIFAAYKVMSAVFTDDMAKLIAEYVERDKAAPALVDMFEFYRHDDKDDNLYDMDDNVILDIESDKFPLKVILKDEEGEELARVVCQNPSFTDATNEIFDIYSDGEVFGTITHDKRTQKNSYTVSTVNGDFKVESFMAVRKANISANYEISLNGVRKAIIMGCANINFGEEGGWMQNNIICSFDDDYLVLYTAVQLFLMNTSHWLR